MGKKMDALLGRSFKTSKLKSTAALAVSRLSVLKNQRQARCSVVRSDVVEFLKTSNHDRALLRIIQKLSTRMPTLEDKTKVLKEIASDNNIDLHLDHESETTAENKEEYSQHKSTSPSSGQLLFDIPVVHSEGSERGSVGRKYKDVADAAQAAFESAAYAAAAARAAVELSRSESTDPPNHRPGKLSTAASFEEGRLVETEIKYEKIHPVLNTNNKRSFSDDNVKGDNVSSDEEGEIIKRRDGGIHFDESDHEDEQKSSSINQDNINNNNPAAFGVEPLNFNRRPISVRNRRSSGR
ncbi:hypothetical protein MIMGU_mgv1a011015mg [Erythranthe guttata]|uniref:Uncharacterized protein n=1 Tax=Erythranthe guttata TaxID=4155 RepID=A0A022QTZ3_ERYGU|nr:hypothetical protein MIMGU_mgv1a011015mg [Erythranthe guttata]